MNRPCHWCEGTTNVAVSRCLHPRRIVTKPIAPRKTPHAPDQALGFPRGIATVWIVYLMMRKSSLLFAKSCYWKEVVSIPQSEKTGNDIDRLPIHCPKNGSTWRKASFHKGHFPQAQPRCQALIKKNGTYSWSSAIPPCPAASTTTGSSDMDNDQTNVNPNYNYN